MLKPSLQLKISQQLTMTPQLQQAIRLLQLPVIDLTAQIQEALEENVMLELEELPEPPQVGADEPAQSDDAPEVESVTTENDWSDVSGRGQDSSFSGGDSRGMAEFADESQDSLHEHLHWQLELEKFSQREMLIGEAIIDAVNDDGYLTVSLEEIREILQPDLDVSEEETERTLRKIQRFDPAGIAARSLAECIDLQLRQLDPDTPGLGTARALAADHLDLLAENAHERLQHELQVSEEELADALALIRACHPRPGQAIAPSRTEYVIPDVFVRKQDGRWIVEIASSGIPRLTVNQRYADMLRGNGGHSALKAQLQEARWLVRSLEIRNETLMKVATCIVERQTGFFEHGEEAMKPMVLRDVAEAVEMHESTISRVTNNKFMHTPRGVLEFRYFFSSHLETVDGEEQSSVAVRAKIRKLVGSEDPRKPLSDSKIAALLKEDGVVVARRTVAKYREAMDIPSSSQRRERSPA
jgi:RNA polymerase sigma-54 factor